MPPKKLVIELIAKIPLKVSTISYNFLRFSYQPNWALWLIFIGFYGLKNHMTIT